MQLFTQTQWWSMRSTHWPQRLQWWARGGLCAWHFLQNLRGGAVAAAQRGHEQGQVAPATLRRRTAAKQAMESTAQRRGGAPHAAAAALDLLHRHRRLQLRVGLPAGGRPACSSKQLGSSS